ncbi:hypothetical protein ACFQZ4_50160 [Catellatospora coxensis]
MRITGYRALNTVQEWGRAIGDANGVYADGLTDVPIVVVSTDEGITGVGMGPHVELDAIFAAIDGEDPRAVTALYDRMLRQTFKAGHAGAVFGAIGAFDTALWDIKAKAAGQPCGDCSAGVIGWFPRTPPPSTSSSTTTTWSPPTRPTPTTASARPNSRAASTSTATGTGSPWSRTCSPRPAAGRGPA